MSNVSGTPTDGQYLSYNASVQKWVPVSNTSISNSSEFIFFGRGESENYTDSPETSTGSWTAATMYTNPPVVGSNIYIYDSAGINTITGATLNTTTSTGSGGGEWLTSVDLPSGTYKIDLVCRPSFSSTGYFRYRVMNGTERITTISSVGDQSSATLGSSTSTAIHSFSSAANLTFNVYSRSGVNTIANLGTSISQTTTLLIEKLS